MSQTPDIPPDETTTQYLANAKRSRFTGEYENAIEAYLKALAGTPDEVAVHKELREVSLERKAAGGKDIGVLRKRKFPTNTSDHKINMLNAERLLAYDPGHRDHMVAFLQSAHRAGFENATAWMESLLRRAKGANRK